MIGRRIGDISTGLQRGDYWKVDDTTWGCCPPSGDPVTIVASLVHEYSDGSITVRSMISSPPFKGYLVQGEWRPV